MVNKHIQLSCKASIEDTSNIARLYWWGHEKFLLQSFMAQRMQKTHSFCQASNSEKGGSQEDLKHLASSSCG